MQEIKFNHNYKKLHNQTSAVLIKVAVRMGRKLSQEFIKYDTNNKYPIEPNKRYFVLYFIGDKFIPFTTLRKFNKDNLKYFKNICCTYRIVVKEQK